MMSGKRLELYGLVTPPPSEPQWPGPPAPPREPKLAGSLELHRFPSGKKKGSTAKFKLSRSRGQVYAGYSTIDMVWMRSEEPQSRPDIVLPLGARHDHDPSNPSHELHPRDIEARLISSDELSSLTFTMSFLNEVMHYVNVSAVFLELDRKRSDEVLSWLARLTQAVAKLERRLSHPVLVTIPPDFTPDRETRDKIVRAGGLPFFAPRTYSASADKETRLRTLYQYLQDLREAANNVRTHAPVVEPSIERDDDLLAEINREDE